MFFLTAHTLANFFGIIGNIVSIGVFLSPIPTFHRIYKKKSSEGYQSIPYAVALFSAMMLLYYGALKTDGIFLVTINSFGCAIEMLYLVIYLVYAPKESKNLTLKLLVLFNMGACSLLVLLTAFLAKGSKRISIVGWINAVINICVFVAPLGVMKQVIKTRSVEFMPISLSFSLTLNAAAWFFYGYFLKDYYIAGPNTLGFLLGMAQMSLYIIMKCIGRKDGSTAGQETRKDSELKPAESALQVESNQQIELKIVYNTEEVQAKA